MILPPFDSEASNFRQLAPSTFGHQELAVTTDDAINSIFLFNNDKILYDLDVYYINLGLKQKILDKVLESSSDRYPFIINLDDGSKRLVFFRTDRETLFGKSQSGVVIVLNPEIIKNNMLSDYGNQPDEVFIVDNKTHDILIDQSGKYVLNEDSINEIVSSEKDYGSYTYNVNNDNCIISYVKNMNENYSVISLIDYQSSIKELLRARNIMILISLVLVLFAILLSYFFTNRTYKPINSILSSIQTAFKKPEQEDEYDEIMKASLAINRAATEITLLESKNSNSEIIEYFKNNKDFTEIPKELKYIVKKLESYYQYRVINLEIYPASINNTSSSITNTKYTRDDITNILARICNEVFSQSNNQINYNLYQERFDHHVLILSENQSLGQLSDNSSMSYYLNNIIEKIILYNMSIYMSVSSISDDIFKIPDYYYQTHDLMKYKLFYESNSFLIFDMFTPTKLDPVKAKEIKNNILESLKSNTFQSMLSHHLKAILKLIKSVEYGQSLEYITNLLADAWNLSVSLLKESEEYRRNYLDIFLKVQSCNNLSELTDLLQHMFNNANFELKIVKSKTVQINILESLDYINEHIGDRTLSIDLIADRCNISPSYFSKLFNSYTKKTFPDYVNNLRLQRAAELLINNRNADINDISAEVGFNSSSYFASAFKKKYGLSPSQYRINYINTTNTDD